jgi:hypothetical protein
LNEVIELNRIIADKFDDLFAVTGKVPVITTLGNNDVHPHNILPREPDGTSFFLKNMYDAWASHIPENQKETYINGGYYVTEIVPNELYVISLNSLYFHRANKGVRSCRVPFSAGDLQLQWLKAKLEAIRVAGGKVHIIGHVPALSSSWFTSCYFTYVDIILHFSDIVLGQYFGHANVDAFFFVPDINYDNEEIQDLTDDEEGHEWFRDGKNEVEEWIAIPGTHDARERVWRQEELLVEKSHKHKRDLARAKLRQQGFSSHDYSLLPQDNEMVTPLIHGDFFSHVQDTESERHGTTSVTTKKKYRQPLGELGRNDLILYILHNYKVLAQSLVSPKEQSMSGSVPGFDKHKPESSPAKKWDFHVAFIGPSIIPSLNPGYRIYDFSTEPGHNLYQLTDYQQYYLPLGTVTKPDKTESKDSTHGPLPYPQYMEQYSALSKFGLQSMHSKHWLNYAKTLVESKEARSEWIKAVYVETCNEDVYAKKCQKLLRKENEEI